MKLQHHVAACALTLLAVAAQAQTVSVTPPVTNVLVGSSFTVDLQASGFPDKIFGGGYNISFDPTQIHLDDIVIPASWEFAVSKGSIDNVAGTVTDVFFNTFASPIKGDFLTSTLKFTAIGTGSSTIALSESASFPFGNEFASAVTVNYVGGTVNVAAVPEPGSWALTLAGLMAVGLLTRRKA